MRRIVTSAVAVGTLLGGVTGGDMGNVKSEKGFSVEGEGGDMVIDHGDSEEVWFGDRTAKGERVNMLICSSHRQEDVWRRSAGRK